MSTLTDHDIYLFKEGSHFHLYEKFGAHLGERDGKRGTFFAVWAPNAKSVSVVGNFNGWNPTSHPLNVRWDSSGIWEGFVPDIGQGQFYKYHIVSHENNYTVEKRDPFGFFHELPPKTASIIWDLDYQWNDGDWMKKRHVNNAHDAPMSIYEMHLGSWKRVVEEGNRFMTYGEIAKHLCEYIKYLGHTHVEFLPIMSHPFYGSWGYQTLGYFAPTNRYGAPQDLMYLIDQLHQNDIGVILDWVPSHFPEDEHGLNYFDGTHLYEYADPKEGFHPDWKCCVFNHGRVEVSEFLISSAHFWLDKYHVDGLRVDAVASMLYKDYSRKDGEWIPNEYGGRENFKSVEFLKRLNSTVYASFPDIQMVAEESTAWTGVSAPVDAGGLGFGMKWNMGWMHDVLEYMKKDPIHRQYHHNELTFSFLYMHSENYLLSLSHDEVVHGKKSLISKMPGDDWQKFANLRLLYSYMYAHPGKKLKFMGSEFAQWDEWHHDQSLAWNLLDWDPHRGILNTVRDLNMIYRREKALFERDFATDGFYWVDGGDVSNSIISFMRCSKDWKEKILITCNFTPTMHQGYNIGVPEAGHWQEIFNSDAEIYGGSGKGNFGGCHTNSHACHGQNQSLSLTLPPLGVVYFKSDK